MFIVVSCCKLIKFRINFFPYGLSLSPLSFRGYLRRISNTVGKTLTLCLKYSEKVAIQALKASDWHLEAAFELFYSQPQARSLTNTRHLEELYNKYKDPYADMITADGITLFCNDLQVDPQDILQLVISWHMKAATMCEFSKQEFIDGLQSIGIDSLEKFRERLPFLRSELRDEQKFREIYNFAFGWAKEKGQKSLALDTAIGMWQLLFAEKQWPLVDHWCQFLQVTCQFGSPII
ncbi:hypothetical protein Leryth_023541 [Lithospermum erythrorhizon]|nr:hypothetical protein Leryth_023541 [Lithospermum erythrorhizon]